MVIRSISWVGRKSISVFLAVGEMTILVIEIVKRLVTLKFSVRRIVQQMMYLGVQSIPITLVTSLSVGLAFAIQVVRELVRFGAQSMVGGVMGLALWPELAPLLIGVVLCGRVGANVSAELGTMKVTEQIEALESMSQDPIDYLILPRVVACTIMFPLLVGLADIVGYLGGLVVALNSKVVNMYSYFSSAQSMLQPGHITVGLYKAIAFGFLVGLISTYLGVNTSSGARGVGITTTRAVVVSLLTVLVLNFILSATLRIS